MGIKPAMQLQWGVHAYEQQLSCTKVLQAGLCCRLSIDQDQVTKPEATSRSMLSRPTWR